MCNAPDPKQHQFCNGLSVAELVLQRTVCSLQFAVLHHFWSPKTKKKRKENRTLLVFGSPFLFFGAGGTNSLLRRDRRDKGPVFLGGGAAPARFCSKCSSDRD